MKAVTGLMQLLPPRAAGAVERATLGLASGAVGERARNAALAALDRVAAPPRSVLVVADVNIGDAVLLAPAVEALVRQLPGCEVDFVCHRKMGELLEPDPAIRRCHPVLVGRRAEHRGNVRAVRDIVRAGGHDLVIGLCPFLSTSVYGAAGRPAIGPLALEIDILRACRSGQVASLPYRVTELVRLVAERVPGGRPEAIRPRLRIFPGRGAVERVERFLAGSGVGADDRLVVLNPDTSNRSTFPGVAFWIGLLRQLVESAEPDLVVLGRGFVHRGVEEEILAGLGPGVRDRVLPAPADLPLPELAVLVDRCDGYVGGDTGPLHIAAARKLDPGGAEVFRNATAVVGVFKATDPRIYGYDSRDARFADTEQDAPARTLEARPPCKNLSCSLQRITETCSTRVCHEALDPGAAAELVVECLRARRFVRDDGPAAVASTPPAPAAAAGRGGA